MIVATIVPDVFLMYASCQSKVMLSVVLPFQKNTSVPPSGGTRIVWDIDPSPSGSGPVGVPRRAAWVPVRAWAVDTTGDGFVPTTIHGPNVPVSKSPLVRRPP